MGEIEKKADGVHENKENECVRRSSETLYYSLCRKSEPFHSALSDGEKKNEPIRHGARFGGPYRKSIRNPHRSLGQLLLVGCSLHYAGRLHGELVSQRMFVCTTEADGLDRKIS